MPKGFGPLSELQYGLADFNPCQQLRMTCEIIHEDVTDERHREFIDLAHAYFEQWEHQWSHGQTRFASISRKANERERETVRTEANRLGHAILSLGLETDDYFEFDSLLKQRVGQIADASTFADGETKERAANTLCWTATRLIFLLKEQGKHERMFVTVNAILFLMMRYGEWLSER